MILPKSSKKRLIIRHSRVIDHLDDFVMTGLTRADLLIGRIRSQA